MYHVVLTSKAARSLKKLKQTNKSTYVEITTWISKNLEQCDNPRMTGKALEGNRKGYWRYRVGDYRIIVKISDKELIILATEIGHRREIYRNN